MIDTPNPSEHAQQERERQAQKIEQLLTRALHELPARHAPRTLEARVRGELQRRAAQPWWRQRFANWPLLARAPFVAICTVLGGVAVFGGNSTMATLNSLYVSGALAALPAHQASSLWSLSAALAALPAHVISPLWLYAALAAGAVLYAALFGLGAVAYRTLYLKPLGGR